MKVLVTGADGMLGSHIVHELSKRKHEISIFVLPNRKINFADIPINRFEGNILDLESLKSALKGHDAIIHAAALTDIWPYRSKIVRDVNLQGTKNVAEASKSLGLKRVLIIGSASSFGFGSKDKPGDETTPSVSDKYGLDYIDSKKQAQEYILREVKENNLPAIMLNPTFMFGAYDSKPGAGRIIKSIQKEKVFALPPGGKNYIAAKDVATATVNALTMGRIGECYILGNENLDFKEAFGKIAQVVNAKAPTRMLPKWLCLLIGSIVDVYSNITKSVPVLSYNNMKIGCEEHYFSSLKAQNELGLPLAKIEVAIKECSDWMEENNI